MDVRENSSNKKRLIDANALLEKLKKTSRYFTVKFDIEEVPTVDAVEVVRCAQCKHFKRNLENDTYCSSVNGLTDPQEDDFCSYGERTADYADD